MPRPLDNFCLREQPKIRLADAGGGDAVAGDERHRKADALHDAGRKRVVAAGKDDGILRLLLEDAVNASGWHGGIVTESGYQKSELRSQNSE